MPTSDILGLFTTPEQYKLAQDQAQQAQAIQYASLNPMAQANYGTFRAGQQLGGAIGGALGGQDPQLKMISMRQQLASQLDPSDPQSYMKVAQFAAQSGDQQFAMAVADAGRQAAVQVAQANKERQLAVPEGIQKLQMIPQIQNAIAQYKAMPQTPEIAQQITNLESMLSVIVPKQKPEKVADRLQIAQRVREIETQLSPDTGVVLPPQIIAGLQSELANLKEEQKQDIPKVGVARGTGEVVYYDRNQDLQFIKKRDPKDPTKQIRVPFEGDVDQTTSTTKVTATSTTGGIKEFKDIPDLRAKIVSVVDPFRKAVNATDMALESLNLSITENNFSGFNAARVQLAKALSGGDLSQKEIAAAGGDPSILGGLIDVTSTAFTGTPSFDTQNKIKNTINAIRKVALQKGRAEIDAQRNVANRSGFNKEDFEAASDIPEFRPRNKKPLPEVKPFDADKEKRYQEYKARQSGATK